MYQKYHNYPWLNRSNSAQKQVLMGVICASSAFLILTLPAIINSPSNKLLAEEVISQDLDAAMSFQQGVTFYNRQDFQGSEMAFRKALQRDPNIGTSPKLFR